MNDLKCCIPAILLSLLMACYPSPKKEWHPSDAPSPLHLQIDALRRHERLADIRTYAFAKLQQHSAVSLKDQLYLYHAIGCSYKASWRYDSSIYYLQKAYALSLQSGDLYLQAPTGADLLIEYCKSSRFITQRDSLYTILDDVEEKLVASNAKAHLLDALAIYLNENFRRGTAAFCLSKSQVIYDKMTGMKDVGLTDSLNLALHYITLIEDNSITINKLANVRYATMARDFMGSDIRLRAKYYCQMGQWAVAITSDVALACRYRDSLILLAEQKAYNFFDLRVDLAINFSDYYYYKTNNNKQAWKYCNEASADVRWSVSPVKKLYVNWLQADLYLKDRNYAKALSCLAFLQNRLDGFTVSEKLRVFWSVAMCYEGLGNKTAAVNYYKKIAPLTVGDYHAQERKITEEAEARYLNKIKQDQLELQNEVIRNGQKQRMGLLIGLFLTLLSIALLVIIYRNKKKAAQQLNRQNELLNHFNEQLNEANNTKSKLFGIISHDLRSPISHLYQLMQLQLAESGIEFSSAEKEMLQKQTHSATVSLLDSMEDLLVWSKTQLQSFQVDKTWVELNRIFRQCEQLLQLQIHNKQLSVINNLPADVAIETDPNFLQTILRNLLNNAINASPLKGIIGLHFDYLSGDGHVYEIRIENEGIPFTQQDYLEALANSQTSDFLKGGLGLQVVGELSKKIGFDVFFQTKRHGSCCVLKCKENIRSTAPLSSIA